MMNTLIKLSIFIFIGFCLGSCAESNADFSPSPTGQAGSLARFALKGNYLYVVDDQSLNVFDVANASKPEYKNQVALGWGIETIFPYNNHIFIGTQTGMQILDNSNPSKPFYLSSYQHVRSCDPVVVQGNYAYVTLRSGNACQGFTNQLDVIDISDLKNPTLKKTYQLYNPFGLGIDGDKLFVCDGDKGLKLFDAKNPLDMSVTKTFPNINAYDVIPANGLLLMIGSDGLYQYDYNGNLVSKIEVVN